MTEHAENAGPAWLARAFEWGPTEWPIAWCEAVLQQEIDCGVFSAFAREIFASRGRAAFGGQVIRNVDRRSLEHDRMRWAALPKAFKWIGEKEVYHEVCIVRLGNEEARVFDPTDGFWIDPEIVAGHGSHSAIRADIPVALRWGRHRLVPKQWVELGDEGAR